MKHTIIIALAVLFFSACKKDENKIGKVTFYQKDFENDLPVLMVDGKKIGRLTQSFDDGWVCGQNVKEQVRVVDLSYGQHECQALGNDTTKMTFTVNSDCRLVELKRKP